MKKMIVSLKCRYYKQVLHYCRLAPLSALPYESCQFKGGGHGPLINKFVNHVTV